MPNIKIAERGLHAIIEFFSKQDNHKDEKIQDSKKDDDTMSMTSRGLNEEDPLIKNLRKS